ncbi:MAG: bacterial transcriptional activator domain-containing protein [Acidobacteriota bacterium]
MRRLSPLRLLAVILVSTTITTAGSGPIHGQDSASQDPAGSNPTATLQQAVALSQEGDWAGAARAYRSVTEADDANGAAWFGLGRSLYATRQAGASLEAYAKALELGFQPPLTMLQLARGNAATGQDEAAIEWLGKAVATGASNLYQAIKNIDEFKRLEEQPAFRQLVDPIRPCSSEAHRLLDFWVGAWRVVVGEGEQERYVGKNSINKILNGCAIIENWTNASGNEGKSLFYYNDIEQLWKQVWVTDSEAFKEKHLIGVLPGGALRFQGEIRNQAGGLILDRTTLYPIEQNRVRQVIEQSIDGGDTWNVAFDAFYVRD